MLLGLQSVARSGSDPLLREAIKPQEGGSSSKSSKRRRRRRRVTANEEATMGGRLHDSPSEGDRMDFQLEQAQARWRLVDGRAFLFFPGTDSIETLAVFEEVVWR